MRRWFFLLAVVSLALAPLSARAADGPLATDPPALTLSGAVGGGALAASLRLMPSQTLGQVRLLVSDLPDATRDGHLRDPLPSSSVTVLPATEFATLTQGTLTQIVVQVAPPAAAGAYTGTLVIHWQEPQPGQLKVPLTVIARTRPALALQGTDKITLNGLEGETLTRRVTLQETIKGSALTGLRVAPQDLLTAAGGVLPASHLGVRLPSNRIEGGGLLTATLTVNLQGVPAGAYTGQVLFQSDAGDLLALPVDVNVRSGPWLPGIVLVAGVGLGLALTNYKASGKQRDELIVRIASIRKTLQDTPDLEAAFGPRLRPLLDKAEAALRAGQLAEAQAAVKSAQDLLNKWYGGTEAWTRQVTYLREQVLPQLQGDAVTLRALRQRAQDTLEGAADLDSPADLRNKTIEIEKVLLRFQGVQARLEEIAKARMTPNPVLDKFRDEWRRQENDLGQRLLRLSPPADDAQAWDSLESEVNKLGQDIARAIQEAARAQEELTPEAAGASYAPKTPQARAGEESLLNRLMSAVQPLLPAGLLLPETGPFKPGEVSGAGTNLALYQWVTYGLGGLILAAVGFNNLYLDKLTFGAAPITDYLTLLAWGLGGQTTFSTVADLVRGWGISPVQTQV